MPPSSDNPQAVQAELAALRKRVAELESNEAELAWAHNTLLEQISHEHRLTESALRLSEEKLSRIYAASPDAIAISSLDKDLYVDANPASARVFGYAPDEIIGRKVGEVSLWPDLALRQHFIEQLQGGDPVINEEIRLRHKSGRLLDCLFSASLVEINAGPCLLTVVRDISDRKLIQRQILEMNRMLHAISEAQADFIADADPHPVFKQLLHHLLDITGSEFGVIGEVLRETSGEPYLKSYASSGGLMEAASNGLRAAPQGGTPVPGDPGADRLARHLADALSSGKPVLALDPPHEPSAPPRAFMGLPLHRGDRLVGLAAVARPSPAYEDALIDPLQPFTATCAVLIEAYRQSQQRQHAEQMLRQLNLELEDHVNQRTAELQASIKELESFSYSVSHDLRSPLRGINGFSRLLQEDYGELLDEQGREYLRRICSATLRMSELIDGMIDLAQLTRTPLKLGEVNLSALAESILHELRAQDPQRRVDTIVAPNLRVRADARLMRVALHNLLANAWKFTARKPSARIEFGTGMTGNSRVFFIKDDGAGFHMKYADKLFGAFQRLHGVKDFSGTGIGLATVQRIIQRHGGLVWAEGEVDRGATFHFTLP